MPCCANDMQGQAATNMRMAAELLQELAIWCIVCAALRACLYACMSACLQLPLYQQHGC